MQNIRGSEPPEHILQEVGVDLKVFGPLTLSEQSAN